MCENKDILKEFSLILRMGKIESGPPLSTILGNIGINTVKVVKELLESTQMLPDYFLLEVKIIVYFDKTYIFSIIKKKNIKFPFSLLSSNLKIFFFDVNIMIENLYYIFYEISDFNNELFLFMILFKNRILNINNNNIFYFLNQIDNLFYN